MTQTPHGQYDRDDETQDILDNPPASVGNPGGSSVLSQLKAQFAKLDETNSTFIRAKNRGTEDMGLWLELDKDLSFHEWNEYRESARTGNRGARRAGAGEVDEERAYARLLVEKCLAIHVGDPAENEALKDDQGRLVTLKDPSWIDMLGFPGNPVGAASHLFGWANLRSTAGTLLVEAGIGDTADVVDPTTGSSGD